MTAADLIRRARSAGVELFAEGLELRFRAPVGAMTPDLHAALAADRAEILALLAGPPASDPEPPASAPAPWPPRPTELAAWPVERREAWGRRAAALEGAGVPWPESERRAFAAVCYAVAADSDPYAAAEREAIRAEDDPEPPPAVRPEIVSYDPNARGRLTPDDERPPDSQHP
jgi:hypothetical protein